VGRACNSLGSLVTETSAILDQRGYGKKRNSRRFRRIIRLLAVRPTALRLGWHPLAHKHVRQTVLGWKLGPSLIGR
jgi:hypothetical protein